MEKTIALVLVTHHHTGKISAKIKSWHTNKSAAKKAEKKLRGFTINGDPNYADYRILGPKGRSALAVEIAENTKKRRKEGVKKAAASRKANGTKPTFILCPTCNAKSKKLFSEMGGLQTRRCRNGHNFEVDTFFGFETNKRRVERTDRPLYTGPMSYNDYVYGEFKNNPDGKNSKPG